MKSKVLNRVIALLLSLMTVISIMSIPLQASARYTDADIENKISYDDLNCREDDCDCLEPENNKFAVVSPSSLNNTYDDYILVDTYQNVQKYFDEQGWTDGLPIVPPTWIKAEKFMRYTPYSDNDTVATVNGRTVTAYQVAANAIMSGCSAEYLPVCIAFVEALGDTAYLDSLRSGELTPMMYVNGPIARQLGIDNAQGMTTEECNIAIARFMELALINLAGLERTHSFGNVQPLVFSEDEQNCINIGWDPHHVEQGYDLNDNVITATSFSMWGNNITPATDLPEEIMKVMAWDITEKNLGGLGGKSSQENADAKRTILITPSVAQALAKKYKSKESLESALVENARRPLWMRTYAYYYANTGGALSKSFSDVYEELKANTLEDAKLTASPAWMNGITYANIDTVATMTKGNTDIVIQGDESRNKTQVMPGGVSVSKEIQLDSATWDNLLESMVISIVYKPLSEHYITPVDNTVSLPSGDTIPTVLQVTKQTTYRIAASASYANGTGKIYYDSSTATLYYYDGSATQSVVLDTNTYADFIAFVEALGVNSSFTLNRNNNVTAVYARFSSNANLPDKNMVDLTADTFGSVTPTLAANTTSGSNGNASLDGAVITMSDTVTTFTADLGGDIVMGDTTDAGFVTVSGTTVTVDPTVKAGATAVIGASDGSGSYRTMTIVNGGDGTYTVTYNTGNTLTLTASSYYLKGTFNNWEATDAFVKTDNDDILTVIKEIEAGTYTFKVHNAGADTWYGNSGTITDTANRWTMDSSDDCTLVATGGTYEFKYEISTNKLSVYHAQTDAVATPTTKTVYVGVIEYITDFVPTLHYWNDATGLAGDATLTATGDTAQYALGSSYWDNAKQNFKVYKTEVPVGATEMKTFKADGNTNWANEDVAYADGQIILLFEYSNVYHNFTGTYSEDEVVTPTEEPTEEPTEKPTEAPTQAPTAAPTQAPTQAPTKYCEAGYYLVGTLNSDELWSIENISEDRMFTESSDGTYTLDYTLYAGDEIKVVYTDGYEIKTWYKDTGDGYVITEATDGDCTIYFSPDANASWEYEYIYVDAPQDPTEPPTEAPTEAPTEEPTEAPTTKMVYVGVIEHITEFTPTLHYWNSKGLAGDATLVKTGETAQFALGTGYWNNAKQNFTIYKAEIPIEATSMKTFKAEDNSCWSNEDITNYADGKIILVFEYSNTYHNFLNTFTPYELPEPSDTTTRIYFRDDTSTDWITLDDAKMFVNDGDSVTEMKEIVDTVTGNVMWYADVKENTAYIFYRTSYYFKEKDADYGAWNIWVAKSRGTNTLFGATGSTTGTWASTGFAESDSEDINNFSYGLWIDSIGDGNAQHAIRWHKTGSAYHLYVPSYVDLNNVNVYTSWDSFSIDNTAYTNGQAISLTEGSHTLTHGTSTVNFTVYQSESTAAMLMTTDEELFTGTTAGNANADAWPKGSGINADNYVAEYKDGIETKGTYFMYDEEGDQVVGKDNKIKKIKGRGNSSFEASMLIYGKYAYNINFNEKVQLVEGATKSKKWCMLANNVDHTMMRNSFIYQLSDDLGLGYGPETRLAEVYDNGKYLGAYVLTEKVEYGGENTLMGDLENLDDGIEDANLEAYETTTPYGEDIMDEIEQVSSETYTTSSGNEYEYSYTDFKEGTVDNNGNPITYLEPENYREYNYLLEFELYNRYKNECCWFVSPHTGQAVVVKYPETASKAVMQWIIEEWDKVETAVYANDFEKYSDLIDVESFAKMYLIQELTINLDSSATSYYVHNEFAEDGSSKFVAGPVWDYDWSMGSYGLANKYVFNGSTVSGSGYMSNPEQMFVKNKALKTDYSDNTKKSNYCFEAKLAQNDEFFEVCQSIWTNKMSTKLFEYVKDNESDAGIIIDDMMPQFESAMESNNARWGVYTFTGDTWGTKVTSNYKPYSYSFNYTSTASSGSQAKTYANTVHYLNDWLVKRRDYMSKSGTNGGNLYNEDLLITCEVLSATFDALQSDDNSTVTITPSAQVVEDDVPMDPSEYTYTVYVNGEAVTDPITFETPSVDVKLPYGQKSEIYIVVSVIEDAKATLQSESQTFLYGVMPDIEMTIMFKSSSSYRYIPTLTVGDTEYQMEKTGKAIATNSSQTQKYYWYTATVTVEETTTQTLLFTNQYSMRATITIASAAEGTYYFGCDNLNNGSKVVDLTDYNENIRNFVKSATHMVDNDPYAAGTATTQINGTIYKMGDTDSDGKVTILDATKTQLALVKKAELTELEQDLADFDLDTKVTVLDATGVQLYLAYGQ